MKPIGYIGLDAAQRLEAYNVTTTITRHRAFNDDLELWAGEWQPIETAPIDERILIAATPDWVIEGLVLPDSETAMGEPVTRRTYHHADGDTLPPNLVPTHWMPLPKHPGAA